MLELQSKLLVFGKQPNVSLPVKEMVVLSPW